VAPLWFAHGKAAEAVNNQTENPRRHPPCIGSNAKGDPVTKPGGGLSFPKLSKMRNFSQKSAIANYFLTLPPQRTSILILVSRSGNPG
jgi:hypothetical protein